MNQSTVTLSPHCHNNCHRITELLALTKPEMINKHNKTIYVNDMDLILLNLFTIINA